MPHFYFFYHIHSDEELDLSTSILDPGGPFMLLNALTPLEPGESLTLLICFTPAQGRVFQETLKVRMRDRAMNTKIFLLVM